MLQTMIIGLALRSKHHTYGKLISTIHTTLTFPSIGKEKKREGK